MNSLVEPGAAEELGQRLRRVTVDSPRRWGRMSPAEMLCHLAESYRHCMGEIAASPADTVFTRNVLKPLALWVPIPWPHGYPTRPEVDPHRQGRKPGEFDRDREVLEASLGRFVARAQNGAMAKHPVFGAMTPREWLRWGWLHANHHLRQFGA